MTTLGARGVVTVRIDRPDDGDGPVPATGSPDVAASRRASGGDGILDAAVSSEGAAVASGDAAVASGENRARGRPEAPGPESETERQVRIDRVAEHRATVDAAYRAYAIDQAYEKISEIERETVTPAMRRIEAEDPDRHLVGLENRLKGKERFTEKINAAMTERARTVDQAVATIKDAIRFTLRYPDERYAEGVYADSERLRSEGFEPVDCRNSWDGEEYKGINSRWRVPGSGQLFEVQFHTQASLDAKEDTHWAYEKLRDPATSKAEQESLSAYQREMSARIPIPAGALDIPNYP